MATTFLVVDNNVGDTLSSDVDGTTDPVTLPQNDASTFPGTFPYHVSVDGEILKVNGKSGNDLTSCDRAQEGTTIAAHSTGANCELLVTAKHIQDLNAAVNVLEDTLTYVAEVLTISSGEVTVSKPFIVLTGEGGVDDDLVGIAPWPDGTVIILTPNAGGGVITVLHEEPVSPGTYRFQTRDSDDVVLTKPLLDIIAFRYQSLRWRELVRNVSGAQYTDADAIAAVPFVIYIPFGSEQSYAP